ncbi:MAG TPA: hypothetical protein VEK07_06015 [Polyangiaceae bacterium]|nr:hypothetical protein [Polyangiaceae bacterium]
MFFRPFRPHPAATSLVEPAAPSVDSFAPDDAGVRGVEVCALSRYSQAPLNDRRVRAAFAILVARCAKAPRSPVAAAGAPMFRQG